MFRDHFRFNHKVLLKEVVCKKYTSLSEREPSCVGLNEPKSSELWYREPSYVSLNEPKLSELSEREPSFDELKKCFNNQDYNKAAEISEALFNNEGISDQKNKYLVPLMLRSFLAFSDRDYSKYTTKIIDLTGLNYNDTRGNNIYHLAAMFSETNNSKIYTELLKKEGALDLLSQKNDFGETPLDLALSHNNKDFLKQAKELCNIGISNLKMSDTIDFILALKDSHSNEFDKTIECLNLLGDESVLNNNPTIYE